MNYLKLIITVDSEYQEYFISELLDLDFYGFEQLDDQLIAFVEKPRFNDSSREYIEQLVIAFPGAESMEMEEVAEENWNHTWEQSIEPQVVGPFLVRPTWSLKEPESGQILLEIDPKMSFGTGYHATTRLMLRHLERLNCEGKTVLDAGTGTGILSIAALKLGAKSAVGFDIDSWSEQNAIENALINDVQSRYDVRLGGFEQIKDDEQFDLTLANINRNVIIEFLPRLVETTKEDGILCLSGLMDSDEDRIRNEVKKQPLQIVSLEREEEWILFQLKKEFA
ncbi:MAG: 50S ribosomal protein L11 methyltransferase [Balneolaceae bacterium]